MNSREVRERYLKYFEKEGHTRIDPAPLVLPNDPTTLFTSSGMQPLVPYLMGQPHPKGKRLVNSQPSFRASDIEDVGDNRHTTFFEMLGNWSLGDYFKAQQLPWFFDFLTNKDEGLGLDPRKIYVSVFEGNEEVEKDFTSIDIWKNIFETVGITAEVATGPDGIWTDKGARIFTYIKDNWWSRSGPPEEMPPGEIGGPDSEVFYDFGKDRKLHENSQWKDEPCHPQCDCGRFLEIGNSVFIQYKKREDGTLEELPQKNVDFGGGLERLVAATENTPDVFKSDLFSPIIAFLEETSKKTYSGNEKSMRVIADHIKGYVMIIASGLTSSSKGGGSVIRKLIDKTADSCTEIGVDLNSVSEIVDQVINIYGEIYPYVKENKEVIVSSLDVEKLRYNKKQDLAQKGSDYHEQSLVSNGADEKFLMGLIDKNVRSYGGAAAYLDTYISQYGSFNSLPSIAAGTSAFAAQSSYGTAIDYFAKQIEPKIEGFKRDEFDKAIELEKQLHKNLSRTTSAGTFKGGLADSSEIVTRYHTATHLLLASLRRVLGEHVMQKGQNITADRSRFDFSHEGKLTEDQLKEVEDLINEMINQDLPVQTVELTKEEAEKTGAVHAFNERYGETVTIYFVGDSLETAFSKEFCGGPHVSRTGSIGRVRIKKQEKIGDGVIRIYLVFDEG